MKGLRSAERSANQITMNVIIIDEFKEEKNTFDSFLPKHIAHVCI